MNFSHVLTQQALRTPEKTALVYPGGSLTYAQFDRRVSQLARALTQSGVSPGDRIAVLLLNSLEFMELYFAAMRLGAVFVPLNFRLARDEIAYAIGHSGARLLVTQASFESTVKGLSDEVDGLEAISTVAHDAEGLASYPGISSMGSGEVPRFPDADASLDTVQRIVYTSGTTSRPKAAMLTHAQVLWGASTRAIDYDLGRSDVTVAAGPLYHVGALDTYVTAMFYTGGTSVIMEKFDPVRFLELVDAEGVTCCWLAPTMIQRVLDAAESGSYDMSALRVVLGGGEAAPPSLLQRLQEKWPQVGFFNGYGLTECQGIATTLPPADAVRKMGSVGRAALLRKLRIVGPEGDLPPGTPGEVLISGPLIFPGYFGDEEASRKALEDGWLHTGDVGYLDEEGYLFIVDRLKDMILSGGENIASSEVERVIDGIEGVREVAVVGVPDEQWGEVPVAFVVLEAAADLTPDDVISHCREHLAKFKVPKHVTPVPELPRTASGKVLKRELRDGFLTT